MECEFPKPSFEKYFGVNSQQEHELYCQTRDLPLLTTYCVINKSAPKTFKELIHYVNKL